MLRYLKLNGLAIFVASSLGLTGCGVTTSSDITIGKPFNLTGQWSGDLVDAAYGEHKIYLTLNDNAGGVTGTLAVPSHPCLGFESTEGLAGEWALTVAEGTATQAATGTSGDNPYTSIQENSNNGTLDFQTNTITEKIGDEDVDRIIYFNLNGNSDSLAGKFNGTFIGTGLACRQGIQGAIFISRT